MASGGSYMIKDATESYEAPVPLTTWQEQALGDGLNGIPVFNAYRLHVWRWGSLPQDDMSKLCAFASRQQIGEAQPTSIDTDPYDPFCVNREFQTAEYTDVVIKSIIPRERGLPVYQNVTIAFEVLVT